MNLAIDPPIAMEDEVIGLFEGPLLERAPEEIRRLWQMEGIPPLAQTAGQVPPMVEETGNVSPDIYNAYRRGRQSACADIVIVTRLPDGRGAVLLSMRNDDVCFPGTWWIYGGATPVYQDPVEFVSTRARRECGVPVWPQILLGCYVTSSAGTRPAHNGSTFNQLYAAQAPFEMIEQHRHIDEGHAAVQLFTLDEYAALPRVQKHWYIEKAARLAIENMP